MHCHIKPKAALINLLNFMKSEVYFGKMVILSQTFYDQVFTLCYEWLKIIIHKEDSVGNCVKKRGDSC